MKVKGGLASSGAGQSEKKVVTVTEMCWKLIPDGVVLTKACFSVSATEMCSG